MLLFALALSEEMGVIVPAMRGDPIWFASGMNPFYRAVMRL
jgi:hypothetical protein